MLTKSFYIREDQYLAVADLSKMSLKIVQEILPYIETGEIWYYFNRLNVPPKMHGKGIAKQLLQQVIEWADQEQVNIYLDINPYGNLNLDQLISLYMRYGFTTLNNPNTMIRRYICV